MDDLTFYYSRTDGYLVRRTHRHDSKKVKTAQNFERTMENATEFGGVAKVAALLRRSMGSKFRSCADARMTSRLISTFHKVMKEDRISGRGKRTVVNGLTEPEGKAILMGFNLNKSYPFNQILRANKSVDLETGHIQIEAVPNMFHWPPTATHVLCRSARVRLDMDKMEGETILTETGLIDRKQPPVNIELAPEIQPSGSGQDVLLLQVQFYIQEGDKAYELSEHWAGCVVGV